MKTNFSVSLGSCGALAVGAAILVSCASRPNQTTAQKTTTLSWPNAYYRTNAQLPFLTYTGKGRQYIMAKLDQIIVPELAFDHTPLPEVAKFLAAQVIQSDPDRRGLNFIVSSRTVDFPPPPPTPRVDLEKVVVQINPPLRNLKLGYALDAITKSADSPLKFSVEEYAIVFSQRLPTDAPFYPPGRTERLDPNTLAPKP